MTPAVDQILQQAVAAQNLAELRSVDERSGAPLEPV